MEDEENEKLNEEVKKFDDEIKDSTDELAYISKIKGQIAKEKKGVPEFKPEEKAEKIGAWNDDPVVQKNKIRAIDTEKSDEISKKSFGFLSFLASIGIVCLLIIALAVGVWGWLAYNDGTLIDPVNLVCGNTTINIAPTSCPPCSLSCAKVELNATCEPKISIFVNSS